MGVGVELGSVWAGVILVATEYMRTLRGQGSEAAVCGPVMDPTALGGYCSACSSSILLAAGAADAVSAGLWWWWWWWWWWRRRQP